MQRVLGWIAVDGGSALRLGLCCTMAAGGAAMLAAACGDGPGEGPAQIHELEQSLCHKLIECGCGESLGQLGLQPPLDCTGWTIESLIGPDSYPDPYYYGYGYEGYNPEPEDELPITLDVECVERLADVLDAASCGGEPIDIPCEQQCNLFFGPGLEGQECHDIFACGRGLVCAGNECRTPCSIRPAGEGERCDSVGCEDGLACGLSLEFEFPVCARLPGPGAPCDEGDCRDGAWCDGGGPDEPICRAVGDVGEPCMGHRECASVYCPAGACAERPIAGMPCGVSDACAEGTICARPDDGGEGTCIAAPPLCQIALELLPLRF